MKFKIYQLVITGLLIIKGILLFASDTSAQDDDYFKTFLMSENKLWITDSELFPIILEKDPFINKLSSAKKINSKENFQQSHKYMGYATLLLAGLSSITGSSNSFHINLGRAATASAIATCATGYIEYSDVLEHEQGLSDTNLHVGLGAIGTLGFVVTVALAESDKNHGGLGVLSGGAIMVSFIKIKW